MNPRHQRMIEDAAATLIAVADDSSTCLVKVISMMENYIMTKTKVGVGGDATDDDSIPPGRNCYKMKGGRLVRI